MYRTPSHASARLRVLRWLPAPFGTHPQAVAVLYIIGGQVYRAVKTKKAPDHESEDFYKTANGCVGAGATEMHRSVTCGRLFNGVSSWLRR